MGESTKIEWTDATYNPWRGCDKVSPGCAHCYMFRDQERYGRDPSVVVRCSDATFYAPLRKREWKALAPGSLVFTCSWSDWFHEDADPWRDEAWEVIRQRPDLVWQILTKRPERIAEHLPADWGDGWPNVWLGVSIENRRWVQRADVLRAAPAAVRFISAEPLLGPLVPLARVGGEREKFGLPPFVWEDDKAGENPGLNLDGIDWIIVGGESGPGHRPMDLEWARTLLDLAQQTDTAYFLKQLGGAHSGTALDALPDDLRVRELPRSATVPA